MFRMLKQDIIVINSKKFAKDLLDGRSNIYSDRPYLATREAYVITLLHRNVQLEFCFLDMAGPSTLVGLHMVMNGAHKGEYFIKPSGLKLLLPFVLFN
jgi:hypothetical protein